MDGSEGEFERIVTEVLGRFSAQTGRTIPDASLATFAARLHELVTERGLPCPLQGDEIGAPGGMTEGESEPLVARVTSGLEDSFLRDAARQLVKACFYPEFKVCRDSFREVSRDGTCRRQELERVRHRISGTHCVDCPHWVALGADEHLAYLRGEWHGDGGVLARHEAIFLPEDFRRLRQWLRAAARR
jgi:hypothetical protein